MSKDWKIPRKCKWPFRHKFADSKHVVQVIGPLFSPLEVCQKCGIGRVFGLGSFDYFTPKAIATYLSHVAARDAGEIVELFGPRGKNGVPRTGR